MFKDVVDVSDGDDCLIVISVHVESIQQPTFDDGERVPDIVAEPIVVNPVDIPICVNDCLRFSDDSFNLLE